MWEGDSEEITLEMSKLLRKTISYHDYREDFYHAFLAGIFAGAGYMVESNKEHGEGRSDVVVYDSMNARVAIFEAKYSKVVKKWSGIATGRSSRLIKKCMRQNMKMIMMKSCAMEFHFSRKDAL